MCWSQAINNITLEAWVGGVKEQISTLFVTYWGHLPVLNIGQEERNSQSVIRKEAAWRLRKGEGADSGSSS